MKLINRFLVSAGILCLGISACQKDVVPGADNTDLTAGSTGDSIYLHRMYEIDSNAAVEDTFAVYVYSYDASRRVISIVDSSRESNADDWTINGLKTYHYKGADTLPYKSVYYEFEAKNALANLQAIDTHTVFHIYDATGRNVYDSAILVDVVNDLTVFEFEKTIRIRKYQYAANNIYAETLLWDSNRDLISRQRDTAQKDINGNVVSSKRFSISAGVSALTGTSTMTYDNKPSPFARLSNFRTLSVLPFGETFLYELQSNNNRLAATEDHSGGAGYEEDLTGKYMYNNYHYPIRVISADNSTGSYWKTVFTYKAL
jgi:hypothetical protein